MQPSRFISKDELFHSLLNELNKCLSFIGIELTEKAMYRKVVKATTLSEAQQRANRFKQKLELRSIHQDVINYCDTEPLVENYFHSVFEAVKSVADRIRSMTGLYADGNQLMDAAFSTSTPLIRINLLRNETERSEHIGLSNLIKGFRNQGTPGTLAEQNSGPR